MFSHVICNVPEDMATRSANSRNLEVTDIVEVLDATIGFTINRSGGGALLLHHY